MSLKEPIMQTTREATSAPIHETFIPPTLLPVCCICGLIRDETRLTQGCEHWVTKRAYRETHDVNPIDFPLTHTYCPKCFTKAQETMRQYFREMGTWR